MREATTHRPLLTGRIRAWPGEVLQVEILAYKLNNLLASYIWIEEETLSVGQNGLLYIKEHLILKQCSAGSQVL